MATKVTEIIVVNDGSTDASQTILDRLQLQNPILKLFHHQNKLNKGRSASRNLGIQKQQEILLLSGCR
jgi:glycosyltransferase involved in cell wall biosynthesis